MPLLAACVITHTPRHLRRTLLGLACQSRRADMVVVSCDSDDPAIRDVAAAAALEMGLSLSLVRRAHTGQSRSAQVRNNAVRRLISAGIAEDALVAFFDGDCCPARECLAAHERLAGDSGLVVGFRVDLTPQQTEAFDEAAVKAGRPPAAITADQWAALHQRHRRYQWQRRLKLLGLAKAHKPKVLSANFSMPLAIFRDINGFDEAYVGWGQEDDDLGRRAYAAGARPVVGISQAIVFHQWHQTRAAQAWQSSPGVPRFRAAYATRCIQGLDNPLQQPETTVDQF